MKKKIGIIGLCLSLILSVVSVFAENTVETDISKTEYSDDIELLINLGLTQGYDAIYDVYSNITRGEFVKFAVNLFDNRTFGGAVQIFKDVDQYDPYYNEVAQLYEKGYISGYDDGYFRPNNPITTAEAAKIIMSIAGYNISDASGVTAYLKYAADEGLMDGISSKDGNLTNGNAVKMMVNALDINIVEIKFDKGNPTYEKNRNETVLSAITHIGKIKGRLTATQYVNLDGGDTTAEGYIIFEGKRLRSYDYTDYLGHYGTCYYKENEWEKEEFDVLYIKSDKRNVTKRIEAKDIADYSNFVITYDDGVRMNKKLDLNKNAVFIYNDAAVESFTDDLIKIEYGYIDLLDNNNDRKFDIVKIYEYKNMVVDSISDGVVYGKYDKDMKVDSNDHKKIEVFNESGKPITFEAISIGNVVSVYKSLDSRYSDNRIKLVTSTLTVTGSITEVGDDDGETIVTIGDADYRVYADYHSTPEKKIAVGDKGTYLLDANGYIVALESFSNDKFKPVYLIKAVNENYDDSEPTVRLTVYSTDTGYTQLYLSDKSVTVDGTNYKKAKYPQVLNNLRALAPEVVMVKLNDGGKVCAIDTLQSNAPYREDGTQEYRDGDSLFKGSPLSNGRYKSETMVFEGRAAIDDETVVFVVPANIDNATPEMFFAGNSKYFSNDTAYSFTPYFFDSDTLCADVVVLKGDTTNVGSESKIGIVKKVNTIYNEASDEISDGISVDVFGSEENWQTKDASVINNIYKITLGNGGGDDTIVQVGADGPVSIDKGDIIKCSFDERNSVTRIVIIYDASECKMVSVNPSVQDFQPGGYRYVMGTARRKSGNILEIVLEDGTKEYHCVGSKPIKIVRPHNRTVETAAFSDIRDGDRVFAINRAGNTVCAYIIRED